MKERIRTYMGNFSSLKLLEITEDNGKFSITLSGNLTLTILNQMEMYFGEEYWVSNTTKDGQTIISLEEKSDESTK